MSLNDEEQRFVWDAGQKACGVCGVKVNLRDYGDPTAPKGWTGDGRGSTDIAHMRPAHFACVKSSSGMSTLEARLLHDKVSNRRTGRAFSDIKRKQKQLLVGFVVGGAGLGFLAHGPEGAAVGGLVGVMMVAAVASRKR